MLSGQGTIQATGNLTVNAGGDFIDQAGKLFAGGNASIAAKGNITQLDLELANTLASANTNASGKTTATSTLISGGDASLKAEGALSAIGANLQSGGKLSLKGATVDLQTTETANKSDTQLNGGLIQYASSQSNTNQTGVTASAAGGIEIEATEGDVNVVGGDLQSASNINLVAAGDVNLIEARDTDSSENSVEEEGGLISGDKASSQSSDKNLADVSTLNAGGGINIVAGGNVLSQGTQMDAHIATNIDAEGDVTLTSAKDTISTSSSEESSSWGSLISEESSSTSDSTQHTATVINSQTLSITGQTLTLEGTGLNAESVALAYDDLILKTLKNTTRTSEQSDSSGLLVRTIGNGGSIKEDAVIASINTENLTLNGKEYAGEQLSSEMLLETIKANNPDLDADQIQTIQATLENDEWYEESKTLSKLGSVLVQAAVGYFTAGVGAGLFNPTDALLNTIMDQAVNSVIKQVATELATAAITGEAPNFDFDQMFESALKAGALAGMNAQIDAKFGFDQIPADQMSFAQQSQQTLLHSMSQSAVYGTDLGETLASNFASQVAASAANKIGDGLTDGDLNTLTYNGAHAALGCALAEAQGGDCGAGALGAVVGENIAIAVGKLDKAGKLGDKEILLISQVGSALIAGGITGDPETVMTVTTNAVTNNYLKHTDQQQLADELNEAAERCGEDQACMQAEVARLADEYGEISDRNDQELLAAQAVCQVDPSQCETVFELVKQGISDRQMIADKVLADLVPEFIQQEPTPGGGRILDPELAEEIDASDRAEAQELIDIYVSYLVDRELGAEVSMQTGDPLPGTDKFNSTIDLENQVTMVVNAIQYAEVARDVLGAGAGIAALAKNALKNLAETGGETSADELLALGAKQLDNGEFVTEDGVRYALNSEGKLVEAGWATDGGLSDGVGAPNRGTLNVTAANPSASERAAAEHMSGLGRNVELRDPVGKRAGGGTSDLLVDGVPYDVYTPTSANPNRIISAIAKKNDQATGIVVDLSNSPVTADQLGNVLGRVNGAGATNITDIVIIGN